MLLTQAEIPSCADCQKWLYHENWKPYERPRGTLVPRPKESAPPCYRCPKSEDGKPNPGAELNERNHRALEYYYRAKAGMPIKVDEIVERNCAMIRWVEDCIERNNQAAPLLFASAMLGISKKKK